MLTILLLIVGLFGWGTGMVIGFMDPALAQAGFVLECWGAFAVSWSVLFAMHSLAPGLLLAKTFALYYALQAGFLAVISLENTQAGFENELLQLRISDHANRILLAVLVVQLGAWLSLVLVRALNIAPGVVRGVSLFERIRAASPQLAKLFGAIAIIRLLYPIAEAGGIGGGVDYFLNVATSAFSFVPLFVPLLPRRHWVVKRLWIVSIVLSSGLGMFTGGRFSTFLPVVLYAVGQVLAASSRRQKWLLGLSLAVLAVPFLVFINFLGSVRDAEGRVSALEVNSDRIQVYISAATSGNSWRQSSEATQEQSALSRLVNWPNLFAVAYSPSPIPFREFVNIEAEVGHIARISMLTGDDVSSFHQAELGTYPATRFGFTVNESTSVEYGLLADGWARGGVAIAFAYAVLFALILVGIELLCLGRLYNRFSAEMAVVVIFLSHLALVKSSAVPFFASVREMVLEIPFTLMFCFVVSKARLPSLIVR